MQYNITMELKIAERLKYLRTEKNLTQKQLGEILNVQYNTISGWEAGTRIPDVRKLVDIAVYFKVTLDELVGLIEL